MPGNLAGSCISRENKFSEPSKTFGGAAEAAAIPQRFTHSVVVGREAERSKLNSFLRRCFPGTGANIDVPSAGHARSLYLSGGPGTGKTCCVRSVVNELTMDRPDIRYLEVNCMNLPQATLPGLFERVAELCGGAAAVRELRGNAGRSLALASARQLAKLNTPLVLVVDEVDQLVKKKSSNAETACALETLFSLPLLADMPAMAIIGIANAVDLLNRPVSPVAKGLAESFLFEPYTAAQLRDIMAARLAASEYGNAAEKNLGRIGIELRVRQVAKHSGDCRRLITFCNQAISDVVIADDMSQLSIGAAKVSEGEQVAESKKPAKIAAPTNTQNDPLASVVFLPIEQQMLLCALAGSKAEAVRLGEICTHYKELCRRLHQPLNLASKGYVSAALSALEERGLLTSRPSKSFCGGHSRTLRGNTSGEQVVELAVSRQALRDSVARVNPLLERCLSE